ncbi:hypothetical protein AOA81_03045 [Methanomassiliicoccales archaeon RumEn M2]|nr:hypothetical protein AOA81_03045 [Methanomassiliicoccales archaeon RumEn M2]
MVGWIIQQVTMMNSKSMVFVVAAILAVAAVGIVINYGLLDNDSEADKTKILIQDDEGVYFWIEGEGDNGFAALDDACEKFDVPLICSDSLFGKSIDSIFGIEMMQVEPPLRIQSLRGLCILESVQFH